MKNCETINGRSPSMREIREAVAKWYGIRVDQLNVGCRKRKIVQARHLAMYLCYKHTPQSTTTVGAAFGTDHTVVVYARRRIADGWDEPEETEAMIAAILFSIPSIMA